jgi:hypothetical protein
MNPIFDTAQPSTAFEYVADWRQHPSRGELPRGARLTMNTRLYDYDDPAPIEVVPGAPAFVGCCEQGGFNYDFGEGDTVLLADNLDDSYPLHLRFEQPVSEIGAYVSADAAADVDYERRVAVKLVGEATWRPAFVHVAPLTSHRGTAPFLTVRANGGPRIAEVGFDVTNLPGRSGTINQVAIGPLFFSP